MINDDIPDYMLEDDSLVAWDYWIRVESLESDDYIEFGPYLSEADAVVISDTIERSVPRDAYIFEVVRSAPL